MKSILFLGIGLFASSLLFASEVPSVIQPGSVYPGVSADAPDVTPPVGCPTGPEAFGLFDCDDAGRLRMTYVFADNTTATRVKFVGSQKACLETAKNLREIRSTITAPVLVAVCVPGPVYLFRWKVDPVYGILDLPGSLYVDDAKRCQADADALMKL